MFVSHRLFRNRFGVGSSITLSKRVEGRESNLEKHANTGVALNLISNTAAKNRVSYTYSTVRSRPIQYP